MNIGLFIFSFAVLLYTSVLFYEVWFAPKKYEKRMDAYRNSIKEILGFSYWTNGYVNRPLVKLVAIFMLLLAVLGVIISFTGLISW